MRLQEMFGRRLDRRPVARRRARRPHVERLEVRAVPASYTAANIHDLVASLGATDARSGADAIARAIGRPLAPGNSLKGRGLPSVDTYVSGYGDSYTIANTYDARGNLTGYEQENDSDGDGVVDVIGRDPKMRSGGGTPRVFLA